MKVKDLSGRIHSLNLKGYQAVSNVHKSSLHLLARKIIKEEYPLDTILEEVAVPGEHLFLDFFLPLRKKVIEVHGNQHYNYVAHFHGTPQAFVESKKRDQRKLSWCELNGIDCITLPFNETEDEWRTRIRGC